MSLEEFVTQYGYVAILVGTFLEGETLLVVAGFLAHRGSLNLALVMASAFAGNLLGDQLYFYVGRFKGQVFIDKRPAWQPKAEQVFHLLERHHILFGLGFRFLYGIRTVTPFILGASRLSAALPALESLRGVDLGAGDRSVRLVFRACG